MSLLVVLFFWIIPHPPISTLFPYTTLFRSGGDGEDAADGIREHEHGRAVPEAAHQGHALADVLARHVLARRREVERGHDRGDEEHDRRFEGIPSVEGHRLVCTFTTEFGSIS